MQRTPFRLNEETEEKTQHTLYVLLANDFSLFNLFDCVDLIDIVCCIRALMKNVTSTLPAAVVEFKFKVEF